MFREYLNRILGSERGLGSNRQVYATPDVIEKSSIPSKPIPSKYEKDIEALKEKYGKELFSSTGLCIISMTLQEALTIMPRERRRIDCIQRIGVISGKELGNRAENYITKDEGEREMNRKIVYREQDNKPFHPKFAQLPIKDLAILNFTTENEVRRFYTGELEWIPYSVVELMLDTRIQARNLGIHKISSDEEAFYILYQYFTEIPIADNPRFLHITVAADILNLTEQHIIRKAKEENGLYADQDGENYFIDSQWLIKTYNDTIRNLGIGSGYKTGEQWKRTS